MSSIIFFVPARNNYIDDAHYVFEAIKVKDRIPELIPSIKSIKACLV